MYKFHMHTFEEEYWRNLSASFPLLTDALGGDISANYFAFVKSKGETYWYGY